MFSCYYYWITSCKIGFPVVSGSQRAHTPDKIPQVPNIRYGKNCNPSTSCNKIMKGAITPPTRPIIEPKPIPMLRTSVGNNSAANVYKTLCLFQTGLSIFCMSMNTKIFETNSKKTPKLQTFHRNLAILPFQASSFHRQQTRWATLHLCKQRHPESLNLPTSSVFLDLIYFII